MLPDRSLLIGQKLVENAKNEKCDNLSNFQTLCLRLLSLIQNLENILKSSKMISLTALLCPSLYARFHPRFQEAKSMFDDFKQMMRSAIDQHLVSITHC